MELTTIFADEESRDLCISTAFIIFTLIACETVRLIVKFALKTNESLLKTLFLEFLASAELCACCFELCVIADNYGVNTYAIYLFLLCVWWSFRWEDASACPYTHIEDFLQGQRRFKHVLLIILIELIGGCSSYPFYVKKFWLMNIEARHNEKLLSCSADLAVPLFHGAFIEGFATCICQLTGRVMSKLKARYGVPISSFVGTTLVVAAFDMSGGYFNPVLATALQYNCGEVSRKEHFIVYWCGPIVGSITSVLIWHSSALSRKLLGDVRIKAE